MLLVGVDLGTQSLKAVVCDERLAVLGSHAVAIDTSAPRPGWAEQDPLAWEAALAPAIRGALAAAGASPDDIAAVGLAGQLDGCVAVSDAGDAPLHPALIWHDKRAAAFVQPTDLAVTGQIADPSHLAPKAAYLRAQGLHAACFHQPVSYLVARLTGVRALDPSHASTTLLYELATGAWSPAALAAYEFTAAQLPTIAPAASIAGTLHARGAALTGLRAGTRVAVGTGDDFATPLGAGMSRPGAVAVTLGTAEVVGAISDTLAIDGTSDEREGIRERSATEGQRGSIEPMVETHAYPTGAYFVENPGWLSGGAVRWAVETFGFADPAELDAAAASIDATDVVFIPALAGAMTPVWRPNARGTLHGLAASHTRADLARAILEGLAFACRDVVERLAAMALPTSEIIVLGGGSRSAVWSQIRADVLGRPHAVVARTDTCAIGAAMLAAVAAGILPDLDAAPPVARTTFTPTRDRDDAYARYRTLVATLLPSW